MRFEKDAADYRVKLTAAELLWLRRALERASFVDTPANEQERILAFCAEALAELDRVEKK